MKHVISTKHGCAMRKWSLAVMTSALVAAGVSNAHAAEVASPLKNRTIGYVLTNYFFSLFSSEQKTECPEGINDGPIAQFDQLYPKDKKRTVVGTELQYEANVWFPSLTPEPFKFKEAGGKIAPGLNLDDKVDANDFTSQDNEPGIDNQLYRALGCVGDYRPGGSLRGFHNIYLRDRNYTRLLLELTNVDSLVDDDDVTVTTYRGMDALLTDASGNEILPNGTQRVDYLYGKRFQKQAHGRIKNGVLMTDPADLVLPIIMAYNSRPAFTIRGSQLKLAVTPEGAKGIWGGYFDIENFYKTINTAYSVYHHNYGGQSIQSIYRQMYKLADAYPDPKTGKNTAISGAVDIAFKQVFINHPKPQVASTDVKTQDVASLQK